MSDQDTLQHLDETNNPWVQKWVDAQRKYYCPSCRRYHFKDSYIGIIHRLPDAEQWKCR